MRLLKIPIPNLMTALFLIVILGLFQLGQWLMVISLPAALAQGQLQSWHVSQRERAERLLSAAITALNKDQIEQANHLLIQACAADSSDAAPFSVLGITNIRQGKYTEALDALKKSYQIKHLAETLLSTGLAYYMQHDYDAAINSWTKALEYDPRMLEVHGDMGFAYLRKGDFVKSDESFRALINARPNSQMAYQGLAELNYLAGHFSAARKAAEHAESIQSYYPVLLLLAKLDFLQGDARAGQKRVSEWQRASSGKKALLRSMTALGYPTQHDFHWDPFLADDFDNGRLLLARAQDSQKKGDSRKRSPSGKQGRAGDSLSRARQAKFASGKDFYIMRELALVEMADADYAAAAEHFSEVLQRCPSCIVDWLHLARVQSSQDKSAEASYAVREFQRQRPDETIAPGFLNLAKGEPATIPDLNQQPAERKKKGGNDSGF